MNRQRAGSRDTARTPVLRVPALKSASRAVVSNALPEFAIFALITARVRVCKEPAMVRNPSSQNQAKLFTYMLDPENRKIAFDAWEKEFGPLLAAQEGQKYYEELLDYVRQSDNPEIVRDFEERFVPLLPTIEEETSIHLLNSLEETLVTKRQPVEVGE
jgi:hypothetical protein